MVRLVEVDRKVHAAFRRGLLDCLEGPGLTKFPIKTVGRPTGDHANVNLGAVRTGEDLEEVTEESDLAERLHVRVDDRDLVLASKVIAEDTLVCRTSLARLEPPRALEERAPARTAVSLRPYEDARRERAR